MSTLEVSFKQDRYSYLIFVDLFADPSLYNEMKEPLPVTGKTYTLFGNDTSSGQYYATVRHIVDILLEKYSMSETQLLDYIRVYSEKKHFLKRISLKKSGSGVIAGILHRLDEILRPYTADIEEHLRTAPVHKIFTDRRLLTTREQYYLYMAEIELVNRINKISFINSKYKIALLPHCLREKLSDCEAEADEIDYICSACSKTCYINGISQLLQQHNVNPYIWLNLRLSRLFRELSYKHEQFGMLGVACIVELTWGMRLCMKNDIPVVGLPLNANRDRKSVV